MDSLRSRVGTKSMEVYPVDYPATTDFPTAMDGIRDASAHIESTATNCPNTNMVLGGFSQGAAVMGFVTANVIPDGAPEGVPNPMPPDVADHVAAVALLGKPNDRFMRAINQPSITVGPLYADKTIDLCVPDDLVCSSGRDFNAHMQYMETGMVDQAATSPRLACRQGLLLSRRKRLHLPRRRKPMLLPRRRKRLHLPRRRKRLHLPRRRKRLRLSCRNPLLLLEHRNRNVHSLLRRRCPCVRTYVV